MHLRLEQSINAPADAVWKTLGIQFADIDKWASFVKSSRPIDRSEVPASMSVAASTPVPGRETVTKATLVEVITAYSDEDRSLTFDVAALPRIVRRAVDTQTVTATSDSTSVVSFEIDFDFVGPFEIFGPPVRRRMSKTFAGVLSDLRNHVEPMPMRLSERTSPMNTASTVHRAALALGAVIITIPGVRILFDTAGYVEDKDNLTLTPDLYSELRALGAIFVAAGFILVIGVVVAGFRHTATLVGVIAFLPQGIARVISYGANDGQTDSYLRVGVVEMVVGVLLLAFLINDARTARKTAHA